MRRVDSFRIVKRAPWALRPREFQEKRGKSQWRKSGET